MDFGVWRNGNRRHLGRIGHILRSGWQDNGRILLVVTEHAPKSTCPRQRAGSASPHVNSRELLLSGGVMGSATARPTVGTLQARCPSRASGSGPDGRGFD